MRLEEVETSSGLSFNYYRFDFSDRRMRKILKRYGMEKGEWYDTKIKHDYDVISDILLDNRDALAESLIDDTEDKEEALNVIKEKRRQLEKSGRKALKQYKKVKRRKARANKYDTRDDGYRDFIEGTERQLQEWERSVEKQLKEFFQMLGFLEKRNISPDEVGKGTLGMTVGENEEGEVE